MEKVIVPSAGGYEKLRLERGEDPTPGDGEVLIRTSAVGVNYADVCVRWGVYESAKKFVGWPITPGFEFSGKVQSVGPGVRDIRAGDDVVGATLFNGYSTHVVTPARFVWKRPAALSEIEAAGFPAVFLTAYHGLFQSVPVRREMRVLIHSAAGGVGSALVQLAKVAGLHVTAVVGASHKANYARELGADVVIDKSSEDLWARAREAAPEGFDLVYDANGPETLKQSYEHLRPTGKLVVYGFHTLLPKQGGHIRYLKAGLGLLRIPRFNPLQMTTDNKSVIAFNLSFLFERSDLLNEAMTDLLKWLNEGKIRAPKVTTFRFQEVAEAHKLIESGKSVGKIVLLT